MVRIFEVFKTPADSKAVKRGFCWPGFFFTWIWAIVNRLWLVGGVLFAIDLVRVSISLQFFQLSPLLVAFGGLVVAFVVGLNGNRWKSEALERRGYQYLGAISARTPAEALSKVAQMGGGIPDEL